MTTPFGRWFRYWKLALLLGAQSTIALLSWGPATSSNHGVGDLFAIPFLLGCLLLKPLEALVLGSSTCLWAITFALHTTRLSSSESLGLIGFRLFATSLLLGFTVQREHLNRSRELLAAVFDSPLLGRALIRSSDGQITKHNSTMAQLLGRPRQSLVGTFWQNLASGAAPTEPTIQTLETAQGQRHLEMITAQLPHKSASESLQLIQVIDRTAHNRDQQMLEQQRAELQRALGASLRSAAMVHELRQPLAVLLLQTRQLQLLLQAEPKALEVQLQELQGTAEQINTTMHGIEALLSSANRRDPQPLDLGTLVATALARLDEQLKVHAIELERGQLQSSLVIEGDQRQLQLAIGNLLRNAIDVLMEQAKGKRQLLLSLRSRNGHAELTVADSGPGLSSCDLSELQLRSSKAGGLGLGLYIVEMVAANHHGALQLGRSHQLGGAEVTLKLALAGPNSAAANSG